MRAIHLRILAVAMAFAAAPAAAQTGPGATPGPLLSRDLSDVASPRARLLLDEAGRVRRAWGLEVAVGRGAPADDARAFLDRFREALAIAPGAELRLDGVVRAHGFVIVRFARLAFGGDVLGASLVLRFAPSGALDYVGAARLATPLAAAARRIDRAGATRILRDFAGGARVVDLRAAALELDARLVPVWRADVAGAALSERTRVIADARSGTVVAAWPLVVDALGRVYASNPVNDAGVTSDVELSFLTSRDHVTGRYFRVMSCNAGDGGCDPAQLASADADGNFLADPQEPSFGDAFAEVHAYHHLNRVAQYFREAHEFTWTCGEQTSMQAFVNYSERSGAPYDNAAFVPSSGRECGFIFFGQGAERDFAYDADVVYHEMTHSVVDAVAGLGFYAADALGISYEPGAVNEGTADYFAATLAGDPALAEYFSSSAGAGEGALRRLDNDLSCPADLVGEPHYDGRLWAGLGWDLREALGGARADALMFATLASLETAPSLSDAAEVLIATASAMHGEGTLGDDELASIEAAVAARGLIGCERVAPLDAGAVRTAYSGHPMLTGAAGGSIAPVHYRIDVPANATRLSLELSRLTAAGRYHLYGRTGSAVRFAGSRRPPVIASLELALDARGRGVIERDGDPPLPRCETLYLAVQVEDLRSEGPSLFTVRAELETSGRDEACPEPDAGVPRDAAADAGPPLESVYVPGGGACRAATNAADWPLSVAVLALLVVSGRGVGARSRRR